MKVFEEFGFDRDNNRFGFGKSWEIEFADGTEIRKKTAIKFDRKISKYIRIWLGKTVLIFDSQEKFSIKKKKRNNFKFIFGKSGELNEH